MPNCQRKMGARHRERHGLCRRRAPSDESATPGLSCEGANSCNLRDKLSTTEDNGSSKAGTSSRRAAPAPRSCLCSLKLCNQAAACADATRGAMAMRLQRQVVVSRHAKTDVAEHAPTRESIELPTKECASQVQPEAWTPSAKKTSAQPRIRTMHKLMASSSVTCFATMRSARNLYVEQQDSTTPQRSSPDAMSEIINDLYIQPSL